MWQILMTERGKNEQEKTTKERRRGKIKKDEQKGRKIEIEIKKRT